MKKSGLAVNVVNDLYLCKDLQQIYSFTSSKRENLPRKISIWPDLKMRSPLRSALQIDVFIHIPVDIQHLPFKKDKTISVFIHSHINTSGNWKNKKLEET